MRFFVALIVTLAAAAVAELLNPLVRISPIDTYGMQLRFAAVDLATIILLVFLAKVLLLTVLGYGRFTRLTTREGFFIRFSVSSLAISFAAIFLFLFTTIPSSPNFLILFCLFDGAFSCLCDRRATWKTAPHSKSAHRQLSRRRFFLTAIVAGGVPLSLAVLAWSYKQWPEVRRGANLLQNQFRSNGNFVFEDVLGGKRFRQPIDFAAVPETGEVFVLERGGRIFRIDPVATEAELMVDFSAEIGSPPANELGAYSLALHPNFQTGNDARLFIFHTIRTSRKRANRLVEFNLGTSGGPSARRVTRRTVLEIPATGSSHNSGSLAFDPEGFLFVGLGDAERKRDSQDPGNLFGGKILRIDPDKAGGDRSEPPNRAVSGGIVRDYFIPRSNPAGNEPESHGEIWAIGLRNPFRLHWEPRLQALLTGDVGQLRWEELNLLRAGDNGGWPMWEADSTYDTEPATTESGSFRLRFPFYAYPHDALNRAVVCGPFYESTRHPELTGKVIFGDNFSGRIWAIRPDGADTPELLARAPDYNQSGISRIATGPDGDIWVAVMGFSSSDNGTIFRLKEREEAESPSTLSSRTPAEIFSLQCAFCHGPEGRGNGPTADEFPARPADFTDTTWQESTDDESIRRVIRGGGPAVGKTTHMPAWGEILTESEISALVGYIRSLRN